MSIPQYHHHHNVWFRPKKSFLSKPQKRVIGYLIAFFVIGLIILLSIKPDGSEPQEYEIKKPNIQQDNVDSGIAVDEGKNLQEQAVEVEFEKAQLEKELGSQIEKIDAEIQRQKSGGKFVEQEDEEDDQLSDDLNKILKEPPVMPKRENKTPTKEKQLD